jgi:predicted nucleic acid-binding protein
MIILDTNVISELTRPAPDPGVISWLDSLPDGETAITAITAAELLYGVRRLPDGRRKIDLSEAVHALIDTDFRNRVEPFDLLAADQYADVVTGRARAGHPIGTADAQIAAICRVRKATLATRNTADFTGTDIDLTNPWNTADS